MPPIKDDFKSYALKRIHITKEACRIKKWESDRFSCLSGDMR